MGSVQVAEESSSGLSISFPDPEKAKAALDAIMERLKHNRESFLEEVLQWWRGELRAKQRIEPVPPTAADHYSPVEEAWAREASERLGVYQQLRDINLQRVARNAVVPPVELEPARELYERLCDMQRRAGFSHTHPSVEGEWGRALLSARQLDQAEQVLKRTLALLEEDGDARDVMKTRDYVDFSIDLARCQALQALEYADQRGSASLPKEDRGAQLSAEAVSKAQATANSALRAARKIGGGEENEFERNAAVPVDFCPAILMAYYQQLEIRLYRPDQPLTEQHAGHYQHYWNEAQAEGAPAAWRVTTKIGVLSDDVWVTRHPPHVRLIAESLFVDMGKGDFAQWVRRFRVFWWGIWVPNSLATQPSDSGSQRRGGGGAAAVAASVLVAILLAGESAEAGQFDFRKDPSPIEVARLVENPEQSKHLDAGARALRLEPSDLLTVRQALHAAAGTDGTQAEQSEQPELERNNGKPVFDPVGLTSNSTRGLCTRMLASNSVRGL